MDAIGLIFS